MLVRMHDMRGEKKAFVGRRLLERYMDQTASLSRYHLQYIT